jgi:hypothetical protein
MQGLLVSEVLVGKDLLPTVLLVLGPMLRAVLFLQLWW